MMETLMNWLAYSKYICSNSSENITIREKTHGTKKKNKE